MIDNMEYFEGKISMKKERESNIELLRILCMIMIVALHFFYHCAIDKIDVLNLNFIFTWSIEAICYMSVDCFVLITGYFSINSKFNLNRIISIAIITIFYSYTFLIISAIYSSKLLNIKDILSSLVPIISGQYWFVTTYILLCLIMPLLNNIIKQLSKQTYRKVLYMGVFCFSIIPTFYPLADANLKLSGGTNIVWFVILYLTGGWIKKYALNEDKFTMLFKCCVCLLIVIGTKVIFLIFGKSRGGAIFYHHNSIFIYFSTIYLFCLFRNIKLNGVVFNKIILKISKLCFGVYIIHENIFIKRILWDYIIGLQPLTSRIWPIFALFIIIIIFTGCAVIELLRSFIFKKLKIDQKIYSIIDQKISHISIR